jgi:hypothetical protein
MMRSICLKIVKVAAVVVCLGIASSACFFRGDVRGGRGDHHEDRHEDEHRGEHR